MNEQIIASIHTKEAITDWVCPHTMADWIPLERNWHHMAFKLKTNDGSPRVLHVVKSQFRTVKNAPLYLVFWETKNGAEPNENGVETMPKEEIKEVYGIEL